MNLLKGIGRKSQANSPTKAQGSSFRGSTRPVSFQDPSLDNSPDESPEVSPSSSTKRGSTAPGKVKQGRQSEARVSTLFGPGAGSEMDSPGPDMMHSPSAVTKRKSFAQALAGALLRTKQDETDRDRAKNALASLEYDNAASGADGAVSDSESRTPPPTTPPERYDILAILKDLEDEKQKNIALGKMLEESQHKVELLTLRAEFLEKENNWLRSGADGPGPEMPLMKAERRYTLPPGNSSAEHLMLQPLQLPASEDALEQHSDADSNAGSDDSMFALSGKNRVEFNVDNVANADKEGSVHLNGIPLQGAGMMTNALDLQERIEELKQRNEELSMQLSSANEAEAQAEAQASKSSQECQEVLQAAEGLHHESEELRDRAACSEDAEGRARRSLADASEKSEELFQECTELRAKAELLPETERRVQQLQRECSELRELLSVADEASSEANQSVEEGQRRIKDLQRECGRLREEVAMAEANYDVASDQENPSLRRECNRLREQVASAMEVEAEVGSLVELLREQVASSLENERDARELAEERVQRCERLEARCGHLQEEAARAEQEAVQKSLDVRESDRYRHLADAATEAVRQALRAAEEAFDRSQQLPRDREAFHGVAGFCKAAEEALRKMQRTSRDADQLLAEREVGGDQAAGLQKHFGAVEQSPREMEELIRAESERRLQVEQLRGEIVKASEGECQARQRMEELMLRNRQLQEECSEQLQAKTGSATGQGEALLGEALLAEARASAMQEHGQDDGDVESELWSCVEEGLHRNQRLQRDNDQLRDEITELSETEQEARRSATERLEVSRQWQQECARLRDEASAAAQAERDARGALEAGLFVQEQLERKCEDLQEQVTTESGAAARMREQVARATQSERMARKSANAASELLRRKEELRKCKQLKDQVTRAVEAEREARKSAEVAVGLRRLIRDLDPGTMRGDELSRPPP